MGDLNKHIKKRNKNFSHRDVFNNDVNDECYIAIYKYMGIKPEAHGCKFLPDGGTPINERLEKIKALIEKYDKLGWKVIPLKEKRPFWRGWDDPKNWDSGKYTNALTLKTIEKNPILNVGIVTGEISNIMGIDVDQPNVLGWNPEPAIKRGVLAHTTSKGERLIFRSTNPEVLNFSKKLVKPKEELEGYELVGDVENKKNITIIEILGNRRQFVAPPSIHPETGEELKWITPLPDNPEDILEINDLRELWLLLRECCENKAFIDELFEDTFKEIARKETKATSKKEAEEILEEWLKTILKHLDVVKEGANYILCRCPLHPPDEHPSFAIYTNTYLGVDFHDGAIYTLKELAEKLGIELPRKRKKKTSNEAWIKLDFKYEVTKTNENGEEIKEMIEKDFGWLKIEPSLNGRFIITVFDKEKRCILHPSEFPPNFAFSERSVNKIFKHVKDALGEELFPEFMLRIQKRIQTALFRLQKGEETVKIEEVKDEEIELRDIAKIDLAVLKEFGIESEDEAFSVAEELFFITKYGGVETTHSAIAEFLLKRFVFRTIRENDEILVYENGVYKPNGERRIKELVQKLLKGYGFEELAKRTLIEEVIDYIRRETYTSIEEFRKFDELELINLKNGVLDLQTFELKPHSPEYLFLWQLPVEYNPKADCPKIKKFISEIVDEQDIETILKMIAYILMPGQHFNVAFYLYGTGANGKTTLLNVITALIGRENVSSISIASIETNRFATWSLFGKLANLSSETPNIRLTKLEIFKKITGYDIVPIERKFKDTFHTYLRCKLIFAGNELPKIEKPDDAFLRRWILIHFPNKFKPNPHLLKELTTPDELSGLLNLVLKYYKKLKEEGFETPNIEEIRKMWVRYSDPLTAFIYECIEIDSEAETPKDDIWNAYYEWCQKNNISFEFTGEGGKARFFLKFYGILKEKGIQFEQIRKQKGVHRWFVIRGIRLKCDDSRDETKQNGDSDDSPDSFNISEALGYGNPEDDLLDEILEEKDDVKETKQDSTNECETKDETNESHGNVEENNKIAEISNPFNGVPLFILNNIRRSMKSGEYTPQTHFANDLIQAYERFMNKLEELRKSGYIGYHYKDNNQDFYVCLFCHSKFLSKENLINHIQFCDKRKNGGDSR